MNYPPKVGDYVRLSDEGFGTVGGLRNWAEVEAAKRMKVTHVGLNMTTPSEPAYPIEVEGPMSIYLLTHRDVEPTI